MKTFTTLLNTEKNKKAGAKPIWILKIPFAAGIHYLSDQIVTVTGWLTSPTTKNWVSSWGTIDEDISNQLTMPFVADFSVGIIIDPNAVTDIHDLLWSESVETLDCDLYLWFNGLNAAIDPPVKIWTGNIIDFVRQNELIYQADLVDNGVKIDRYPGRVLSLSDYANASLDDVGKQMPIIYGTVAKVPALRLDVGAITTLVADIEGVTTAFTVTDGSRLAVGDIVLMGGETVKIISISGNSITLCYRGYNSPFTGTFSALGGASIYWSFMAAAPNGDIYAVTTLGTDVYKQTGGMGSFTALGKTGLGLCGVCVTRAGDVYVCSSVSLGNGEIYKQAGGMGAFNALSQTHREWAGMCVNPANGDVYACCNGGIYKQTAGSGDFDGLGVTALWWTGMAATPDGNIYACAFNEHIYMQTAGTGAFNSVESFHRYWVGIAADSNGNVYATNGVDVYKQTGGAGSFVATGQASHNYSGMTAAYNGDLYTAVNNGDIYKLAGSSTAHSLGELVIEQLSSGVFMFSDHPCKSIDVVYGLGDQGNPIEITSHCTLYTGQGGAHDLAGYAGKAVITCQISDYVTNDALLISGTGYQDDGGGTFTGAGTALIEQPDYIFKHFLYTYASWPVANFSTDANASFVADAYKFSMVINKRKKIREWLTSMALQCRCWFRFAMGNAYLLYRPDSLASDKTITAAMTAMQGDFTTSLIVKRSQLDEVINLINLYYGRDWSMPSGSDSYQAIVKMSDATSITAYGEKEQSSIFRFDFVTDSAVAADLAAFYLARYKDRKKIVTLYLFLDNVELEFSDAVTLAALSNLVCEVRKVGISPGTQSMGDSIILQVREY